VGHLQVDDQDVDLGYLVQDGDRLKVFPPAPGAGKTGEPLRFLLDGHLGKLATYLRLLGFDAVYQNDFQDDDLAELAARGGQILLSRDRGLLMRNAICNGYCLRSLDPKQQLLEVVQRYGLAGDIHPFQRCLRCNARLQRVEKALILDQLEPLTRQYFDEFHRCPDCGQIYWKGSHYDHMQAFLQIISNLR
jgi:uncharacterized protein with PIN domain